MPVITLHYDDLEDLIGADREAIIKRIPMIGADIERAEEEHIDIEFFPDRPDLYSVEGVARAMRGFLDIETGLPTYEVSKSDISITLDHEIGEIRPFLACAVIKDLTFTSYSIESLMNLQEDLHWGLGRNRAKVSIGVHDLDRVTPPFKYIAAEPSYEFVPLDFDTPMSMTDILKKHPKGVKFAHLAEKFDKYPLIIDSNDNVLSFPPIINGTLTRVEDNTKNLFIEVTGTGRAVFAALNIVVTALAERGGRIESVQVCTPEDNDGYITPDLNPAIRTISRTGAVALLGFELSSNEIAGHLRRMRFGAVPESEAEAGSMAGSEAMSDDLIEVAVPAYRADIMHDYDIFEDIAIGHGYEQIVPALPATMTIGEEHPVSRMKSALREIMVGLSFYEVMPFALTSETIHFDRMQRPRASATHVMHPISQEQTILRTTILPNLLEILSLNQHRELPQQIFEVGDVVANGHNKVHLAAVAIDPHANFSEIRAAVDTVMHERGVVYKITDSDDPAFIQGRRAEIVVDGKCTGVFGEVHPGVILNFGLDQPVIAFEMWGL